jgi:hypothetical protein
LNNEDFTEPNRKLNVGVELRVLVVEDFDVIVHLLKGVFHPFSSLGSRVNDQRGLNRVHDHDSVLHRKTVSREAFLLPGQHLLLRG